MATYYFKLDLTPNTFSQTKRSLSVTTELNLVAFSILRGKIKRGAHTNIQRENKRDEKAVKKTFGFH